MTRLNAEDAVAFAALRKKVDRERFATRFIMAFLGSADPCQVYGTRELVDHLWPKEMPSYDDRCEFIRAVVGCAANLPQFARRSNVVRTRFNRPMRPWLWSRPSTYVAPEHVVVDRYGDVLNILRATGNGISLEDAAREICDLFKHSKGIAP